MDTLYECPSDCAMFWNPNARNESYTQASWFCHDARLCPSLSMAESLISTGIELSWIEAHASKTPSYWSSLDLLPLRVSSKSITCSLGVWPGDSTFDHTWPSATGAVDSIKLPAAPKTILFMPENVTFFVYLSATREIQNTARVIMDLPERHRVPICLWGSLINW